MPVFREASAADSLLISHIFACSWRQAYRGIVPQHYLDRLSDEYWVPSVRAWLVSERFSALMVQVDGHAVGCAIFGGGRDEDHHDWGEIVSIYLLPEHMRHGYGTALMDECMRRMRQDGYHRFYLWAIEGNRAADCFYRRYGFHRTGDRIPYRIGGEMVHDVRYVLVDA